MAVDEIFPRDRVSTYDEEMFLLLYDKHVSIWAPYPNLVKIDDFLITNQAKDTQYPIAAWAVSDVSNIVALGFVHSASPTGSGLVYILDISDPTGVQILGRILLKMKSALLIPELKILDDRLFVEYCNSDQPTEKGNELCEREVWDISSPESPALITYPWLDEVIACQRAGRNFTKEEWAQYFPNDPYRLTCEQWPAYGEPLTAMDN